MASQILVVQFRRTDPRFKREPMARVLEGLCTLVFKNALAGEIDWAHPKEETRDFSGIILSGSAVLYFDGGYAETHEGRVITSALVEEAKPFARYLLENDFPTLGICFGHQLLGFVAGASVGHSEVEGKTGTHSIELTAEGKHDPLMRGIPDSFRGQYGHKDVLFDVPEDAVVLARGGEKCRYSAVRYAPHVYGMQFHPEYSKEEIKKMVTKFPEYVPDEASSDELFEDSEETEQVLKNFVELATASGLPTIR